MSSTVTPLFFTIKIFTIVKNTDTVSHFSPTLIFAGKGGAYPIGVPQIYRMDPFIACTINYCHKKSFMMQASGIRIYNTAFSLQLRMGTIS